MRAPLGAMAALTERARADAALAPLCDALGNPRATELLAGIFSGSPFLTGLIERDPARLEKISDDGAGSAARGAEGRACEPARRGGNAGRRHARLARVQDRGGAADGAGRSRRRVAGARRDGRADRVRRRGTARRRRLSVSRGRGARPMAAPRPNGSASTERLHRACHGQVRRRRAQLFQRHRSHRLLRAATASAPPRESSRRPSSCA